MASRAARLGQAVLDLIIDDSKFHSKLSGAYKAAQSFTDQTSKSLTKAGKAITGVGESWSRNITAPIAVAGGVVTKFGLDFDTTMSEVVALTSVTEDQIGGIREELMKLGPEVGKSPQELAEAFYFVASAGFDGAEAMDVLKSAAKAASAGLGDTSTVAKVVGTAINAYGRENITAAQATDTLVAAIGEGSAEAPEFAGALGNVIGSAAQIGASFADVTAAIAAMTNVGIGAEEAVTSLNQVFVSLFKPTAEASEALADMGLSAAGLRQMIAEQGLLPTLQLLSDKFEGNAEATAQVFGNVRALRGVLALTGGDVEKTTGIFERMQDTVGATGEAFDSVAKSDAFKFRQAMAQMQATAIELGADVLPVVVRVMGKIADAAKGLSEWWSTLDHDQKELIVSALAWIAIAGPLLVAIGKLTTGVGQLFKAFAFITGSKGIPLVIAKLGGLRAALLAGGVVGILIALAGAIRDVTGEAEHLDAMTRFAKELADAGVSADEAREAMEKSGKTTGEFVTSFLELVDAGTDAKDALDALANDTKVSDWAKDQAYTVEEAAESFDEAMLRQAKSAMDAKDATIDAFEDLPPELRQLYEDMGVVVDDAAPKTFEGMIEAAREAAKATPEAIIGEFATGKIGVQEASEQLAALIPSPLRAAALEALGIVRALPGDIAQSILDGRDAVVTAASGLGAAATDPLVNQARIDETRRQMDEIVAAVEEGGGKWTAQQQADYATAEIMLAGYLLRADPKSKEAMGLLAKYAESEDPATQKAYENLVAAVEDRALVLQRDVEEKAAATGEALPDALARTKAEVEREAYVHFLSTIPPAQRMKDDINDLSSETARATREALDAEKVRTGIAAENVAIRVRSPLAHLKDDAYWWGKNVTESIASGLEDAAAIAWLNRAASSVASVTARKLTIHSEPPDHSSALYGVTKWGGNIVKTIAGDMMANLRVGDAAAAALASVLVPSVPRIGSPELPALATISAPMGTAERLGGVTNLTYQWILNVEGTRRVVDGPQDAVEELQRIGATWG